MQASIGGTMLKLAGALVIVAASFFITLKALDYWGQSSTRRPQELGVNVAALPHMSLGQILDFANGQNSSALISGWSGPELTGVWSDGNTASVGFVMTKQAGTATPKLAIVHAKVFPGTGNGQRVEVRVGAQKLAEFYFKEGLVELEIPLDRINIGDGVPVILALNLPDAASPAALHIGSDHRTLGLFIMSLRLAP